MTPDPLKFRCDQCGQLLGVSPSRAGRPVKCPKCGAGLVVPIRPADRPGDRGATKPASKPSRSVPGPARVEQPENASPGFFDAVDLEQEELDSLFSVESGEFPTTAPPAPLHLDLRTDDREQTPDRATEERSPGFLETSSQLDDRENDEEGGESAPIVSFEPDPSPAGLLEDAGGIRRRGHRNREGLEPSSSASSTPMPTPRARPGRDVVMPRVAFVAWSLFVLLALFLAFVSGLLVGRFVWTGPV